MGAALVARLRERREELADAIEARIEQTVPHPIGSVDGDYRRGMRRAIEALLDYTFDGLTQGPEHTPAAPPDAALAQARRAARADVGVGTVLRRYLAGHGRLGELLADAATHDGGVAGGEQALRDLRARQATLVERLSEEIEREYERERQRLAGTPERRRNETIRRLLAGEDRDPADTTALGYRLDGRWHTGVVVSGRHAEEAVRALKHKLTHRLLWTAGEPGIAWAWLGHQRKPTALPEIEELTSAGPGTPPAVATGEPAKGLDGWRLTHRQARETMALAERTPTRLAHYGDAPLLVAALNNDTLTQSLTALLARLDNAGNGGKLRRTLRTYIDLQCNATSTAALLGIGRHTAEGHIRASEELLGRTLTSCLPALHTALALDELERATAGDTQVAPPA